MRHTSILLTLMLATLLTACDHEIKISSQTSQAAVISPDYQGVTVPVNIAPLNFHIFGEAQQWGAVFETDGQRFSVIADADADIEIPIKKWRKLLAAAAPDSIRITICRRNNGAWEAMRPFSIYVSSDSIDRTLAYRLIQPLYGTWRHMGIYQRDLENYDETPIYENAAYHGNCVNCHSFCSRNPQKMQVHLRGDGGGTYIIDGAERHRLDTKTDSTISNFTYPYWHPSGRYIAYSVNNIFQVFHNSDPNRTEVIDDASDIVVYDLATNTAFSSPLIKRPGCLETFPAFSPDGKRLYFCSAALPDSIPEKYKDVHYSLCSIAFDTESGRFGNEVDTLLSATDSAGVRSVSFPRPSPDGRWLVATVGSYGNFSIWHKDADLWLYDTATKQWHEMSEANSDDVESYHSWSTNGKWLVFSSRRDDGLYTRPYFVHIDADGRLSRPFILPQRHPVKYYKQQMNSYNIPELVNGPIEINTVDMVKWIAQPSENVNYRK